MRYSLTLAALVLPLTVLGGCASRGEFAELRTELEELTRAIETRDGDTAEALSNARLARDEIGAVRVTAEGAARDAAASRRLLEEMDASMGGALGSGTLK